MLRVATLLLLVASSLLAQLKGTLNGDIVDSSGAAIPGAKVMIRSASIGLERDVTSNETGSFTVTSLPGGMFAVTVEAAGFKSLLLPAVRLETDQSLTLKLKMDVGQVSDRVEVTAEAPTVETTTGDISRLVTGTQLQNYALPGRNPYFMLGILPGVVSRYGNFTTDFRATSYSMGALTIDGNRKDTNFVTLDGINNGRIRDGVQVNNILGVDFIEEVKVFTSRYASEFGRSSGGQINFITRRGTQDFHLSAYEFFMSNEFAARTFVTGQDPRIRYHNYGFTLNGPAYLPKRWNTDKSKLFWFFGYEARYLAGFNQKGGILPTALERAGNFSASKVQPIDPDTGAPFPNGIIPVARISNLGRALQKIYPDPNYTGPGGNFLAFASQPTDNGDYIFRADYNLRQNTQLTVRGLHGDQNFISPFDNTGNNMPLFTVYRHRRGNNYAIGLNTAVSPTKVNEFSVGESDYRENFITQGEGYKRSTWGVTYPTIFGGSNGDRIPNVNISGLIGLSGSSQPSSATTPTFVVRDNFSWIHGKHNIKLGVYFESLNMNELNGANDNGSFSFANTSSNPRNTGVPFANALLGNFDAYSETGRSVQTVYHSSIREFYIQDSWRLTKRLTLEFGLRYSLIAPWGSLWNNEVAFMQRFWDPAKAPQVAANGTIVPGTGDVYNGLVLPGSGFPDGAKGRVAAASDPSLQALFRGIPAQFNPLDKAQLQPRIAIAWDPFGDGKTAIRAGFGHFTGTTGIAYSGWYLGARAPLVQSITITNGNADNPGGGSQNTTRTPIDAGALPAEYKMPDVFNYSLAVQRQLPFSTLVDVSYVGSSSRHLSMARNINQPTPDVIAAHQGVDLRPYYPYRGLGTISMAEPAATAQYHSMQVLVKRRMKELSYSFAYTLSKNMGYGIEGIAGGIQDPLNARADYSELEESRRHNIVITHTYEPPWFKNQKGFTGRVLGGWSVNGLWTWNTGRLYAPSLNAAPRQVATRPDLIGNWELPSDQRTLTRYFNTSAFARPADFTYGNAQKWLLRGGGSFDLSAFALKEIRIAERARLQLRLEAFNALNHPYYNDIGTTFGNSNFGQITGVATQRYIQLGGKFFW